MSPTLEDLPTELLLRIISMTNRFRSTSDILPNRTLPRLARVSKTIHAVTIHVLYSDVYIASVEYGLPLKKMRSFTHTVSENVHLASLVRSIHFASQKYVEGETRTLAKAIKSCPNLEGLAIWGWNWNELDELKEAMTGQKRLKALALCSRGIFPTRTCGNFCSVEEFINMLQAWPLLERVITRRGVVGFAEFADTEDEERSEDESIDGQRNYSDYFTQRFSLLNGFYGIRRPRRRNPRRT